MNSVISESKKTPIESWKRGLSFLCQDAPDASLFSHIKAETLLIVGEKENIFSVADHEKIKELVPGSRLVIVKNAGHSTHWDVPQLVAEEINKLN